MQRREFIRHVGILGAATTGTGISASAIAGNKTRWKMVTAWPRNFPGLGTGAEFLASLIDQMSDGEMTLKVYGANELVPPFECFDAVSRGTAQMGHTSAYYWKGKQPAAQFFSAMPFGLTAQEMNAWLYHGGGMGLWREIYEPFGLLPAAAGNTGVQMAGWFNREINSIADLKGLKMRIPGLGGEVLRRAGGVPVSLPGGEIFTALRSGAIDATEWVGPYNDLAFGLYKAARYYYYPGWHEPGAVLETLINRKAYAKLPGRLQAVVMNACRIANQDMLADFTAKNNDALQTLVTRHKVSLRKLPDDVLIQLRKLSQQAVAEVVAASAASHKVHQALQEFRDKVVKWHDISERAYLNARAL